MIREFASKNSVVTLAFLVASLDPVDADVITFCVKKRPKSFLNKITHSSTIELHDFLMENRKIMDKMDRTELNQILYDGK